MMILPEPWCFTIGPTRWTNTRSEQVHLHDKLQERRVKGAGLGVHGPTATAACIHDQDVDPTPSLDAPTTISVTASWSVTSISIPKAVPSVASI